MNTSTVDRNIVGNVYDKYGTSNPLARKLMHQFLRSVRELYEIAEPESVLEVGCGEGHLAHHLVTTCPRPRRFEACDLSIDHVAPGLDALLSFRVASVYDLPFENGEFDLVVCCEVLEHLEHPARALAEVARVARRATILSTPREPLWRALNLLRGKYLADLGNTPGHIQHFSKHSLLKLVRTQLTVCEIRNPIPWTVVLGRTRV